MKIFFVGGGTGGPTAALLAVAEALHKLESSAEFFLISGGGGVEKKLLENFRLPITHLTIPAGKWRRPFSFLNLLDFFKTAAGFLKSWFFLHKYKPDLIFGAGSYVQVPMSFAGYVSGVPIVIHQQDFVLSLSTRLVRPIAKAVTVSFSFSGKEMPEASGLFKLTRKTKIHVTGNPVRKEVFGGSAAEARKLFGLNQDYPTVLIMGGGSGAAKINEVVASALPELTKYVQVIHLTGAKLRKIPGQNQPHYHAYEFLSTELKHAYAVADLVVSRAGMSTISELAVLGKAVILIPLPQSPQEINAGVLARAQLVFGVAQELLTPELLVRLIRKILWDRDLSKGMSEGMKHFMPRNADRRIAHVLLKVCEQAKLNP
jgi:UDP-N-acetylglucosamine--N-acetylmuramyl-(pentapeptide) pyrophosphoryl-undecaprenol N-acetylglucosamine transferase